VKVLGIDPGSIRCGWGIVERRGTRLVHHGHGVVRLTDGAPLPDRLARLRAELAKVLDANGAVGVAVEDVFSHKNARAALLLGHARGVVLEVCAARTLEIAAYPPALVKRAVTGSGKAEKPQVAKMVQVLLGLAEVPPADAADALAVAICHANRMS
jgi:crossover junction endodeoxyribonuclease RuvC